MSVLRGNAYLRSKRESVKGIFSVAPRSVIRDLHKAVFLVECTLDQLFGQIRDVFAGKGLIDVEPEDLTVLVVVGDGVSGYIVSREGDIPVLLIETDADELRDRGDLEPVSKCCEPFSKHCCAEHAIPKTIVLPNGTGKTVRVMVFCKGDKVDAALAAGADYAGADEYMQKIQGGWMDFDVVIASPDMMGVVGRLGKILGPRGLMPSPKAGTVTPDVVKAVQEAKAGKIEYRLDKTNIIHCPIGKASFGVEKLQENFDTLMGAIVKAKPAAAKGQYVRSCVLATTMGPGVKVNPSKFC